MGGEEGEETVVGMLNKLKLMKKLHICPRML